jgi:hypothetical protein
MDWNTLLFAAKWAIIGLVYFVLFILVIGVYREMSSRVGRKQPSEALAYGKLCVIRPGNDGRTQAGTVYPLRIETSLGAAADNDIVLSDPYISGHHARLRWDGANWWVTDLDSTNGTTVNRQACLPQSPQVLPRGATLELGNMIFELQE